MMHGIVMSLLAAMAWGSAIVLSKAGLGYLDAGILFLLQLLAATAASWMILLLKRQRLSYDRPALRAYAIGTFEPFLAYLLCLYGLQHVAAGIASLLFSTEAIMIVLLLLVVFRQRIRHWPLFTLLLIGALLGDALAALSETEGSLSLSMDSGAAGSLLILGGVFCAALYVVIASRLVASFDPLMLLVGQLSWASCLSLLFIAPFVKLDGLSWYAISIAALSGVLQYFCAFWCYLKALQRVSVVVAGTVLYLIPVIALTLAYVILQETISWLQLMGMLLALISIALLHWRYH